ncbi:1260_t:CDS:2 [Paraglomus occultum]|uniref:1260_t:CDS:1 n=1 Tax=Paraglomus occultum TaxID=144539 RepID=A0A9N9BGJ2_9GLOM|nr:1260_t:CDS:2 [Paraglomus occultum]
MSTSDAEERTILFDNSQELSEAFELQNLSGDEDEDEDEDYSDNDQQTFFRRPSEVFDFDDHRIPLSLSETQKRPSQLKKEVGFINGLTLVIGLVIGSGIFASPGPVASHAGSVGMSLVVWFVCGVLVFTGALSYAELGAEIPLSGGEYAYLNHAYGSLPAFLYSWTAITCLKPGSNAIIATVFAEYVNRIIYHTAFENESDHPTEKTHQWFNKIMATICIIVVSFINAYSVKLATRTQDILTAFKLVALAVITIIGFVVLGKGGLKNNIEGGIFEGSSTTAGDYALAIYSGLWAYDGWNNLNFVAGEMKNPARDLPRVTMVGLPIVILCYLLTNVAYYAVLPSSVVTKTNTIALDFGRQVFGGAGGILFALLVAASCFGAANGSLFTGGRVIYVASREGYLPAVFGRIHSKWNTPTMALALQAVLTIIMIIPGTFTTLVNFYSVAAWLFYFLTTFGLIVLRWREPTLNRPYRVWITTPIIFCFVSLFLITMPFVMVPLESLAALGFIVAGVPLWYMQAKFNEIWSTKGIKQYLASLSQRFHQWRSHSQYQQQQPETVELS